MCSLPQRADPGLCPCFLGSGEDVPVLSRHAAEVSPAPRGGAGADRGVKDSLVFKDGAGHGGVDKWGEEARGWGGVSEEG